MRAIFINEKTIACPVCFSIKFSILSRLDHPDGTLVYECECENCFVHFNFLVDKKGEYILDTAL